MRYDGNALAELLAERERRRRVPYVPAVLHAKQLQFIRLTCLEALFGGSAGGGKTEALLADPLQCVHVPRYSAIILRRTFSALNLPSSIMHRAQAWLGGSDAVWSTVDKRWTFPSGATLQFGYCDTETDLERYKSAEFQYIGIDELTEWPEQWVRFLFSRLRRAKGSDVTLKFRSATNPDGVGQEWVRKRFGIPLDAIVEQPIWTGADRVFVPARAEDNPSLDLEAYDRSLQQLVPAKYQQLRWGRWMRDTAGLVYVVPEDAVIDVAPDCDRFVLGIDYGYTDKTAFTVWGWREHDPVVYMLASEAVSGLTPGDAARRVRALEESFAFDRIVADIGGLGKGYAEEARQRFALPIEPALKQNKRGYVDLFNGDIAAGRVKVVRGTCGDFLREASELPWKHDRSAEADGFDNHACDASLYGWRACRAFRERPEEERSKPGTRESYESEAAKMKERVRMRVLEKNDRAQRSARYGR